MKLSKQTLFEIVTEAIIKSIEQDGIPVVAHIAGNDPTEALDTVCDQWSTQGLQFYGTFEGDSFCIIAN
jgi:hypothetical protein